MWRRLASVRRGRGRRPVSVPACPDAGRCLRGTSVPATRRSSTLASGTRSWPRRPIRAEVLSLHFFLAGDDRQAWRVLGDRGAARRVRVREHRGLSVLPPGDRGRTSPLGGHRARALVPARGARRRSGAARGLPGSPRRVSRGPAIRAGRARAGGPAAPEGSGGDLEGRRVHAIPALDQPRQTPPRDARSTSRRTRSGLACRPGTPTSGVGRDGVPRRSAGPGARSRRPRPRASRRPSRAPIGPST